jgi:acetyl-CoA carboxylase carboxyl transferase subunit alpha
MDAGVMKPEEKEIVLPERSGESLTPWRIVQMARHPDRPVLQDYIDRVFSEFIEQHGDRLYGDDQALIGGFATIDGRKVMLIGHNKGKNIEERVKRNFGSAKPEGNRKALRLMHLAEKFNTPVVTFIDTQAAFAGREAEERGQHESIARNLAEMIGITVPIVVVVTGEGGSGGALCIGVGDVVCMLSNAIYSVIPPEGCAAILWRDSSNAPLAAEAQKLTAPSLFDLGVIDEIVEEPPGGAHVDPFQIAQTIRSAITRHLTELDGISTKVLRAKRFEKFSRMGQFTTIK